MLTTSLDKQVIADARRIVGEPEDSSYIPSNAREFSNRIFHTCYMGTENSSVETQRRAKQLANSLGRFVVSSPTSKRALIISRCSYHTDLNMTSVVNTLRDLFFFVTGLKPQYRVHGGTNAENLALQNIQARLRMVLAYFFAQLLPWVRGRQGGLLVLGSANVDERLIIFSYF